MQPDHFKIASSQRQPFWPLELAYLVHFLFELNFLGLFIFYYEDRHEPQYRCEKNYTSHFKNRWRTHRYSQSLGLAEEHCINLRMALLYVLFKNSRGLFGLEKVGRVFGPGQLILLLLKYTVIFHHLWGFASPAGLWKWLPLLGGHRSPCQCSQGSALCV